MNIEITREDREQVLRYWVERGILRHGDAEFEQYLSKGTLPGGVEAADRLARHFAVHRMGFESEIKRYQDIIGNARVALDQTGIFHATGSIAEGIDKLAEQVDRWLCCMALKTQGETPERHRAFCSEKPSDEMYAILMTSGPLCSVCHEPQYQCPAGTTCPNGHGGAPSL